jgi:hypothetical protein
MPGIMKQQLVDYFTKEAASYARFDGALVRCEPCGTFQGNRAIRTTMSLDGRTVYSVLFPEATKLVIVHPLEGGSQSAYLVLERLDHTNILKSAIPANNDISLIMARIFPRGREEIEKRSLISRELEELIATGVLVYRFRIDTLIDEIATIVTRKWSDEESIAFIKRELVPKLASVYYVLIQTTVEKKFD